MKELLKQFRLALIGIFLLLALSLLAIEFPIRESLNRNVQENYIHEGEISLLSISNFLSHCTDDMESLSSRPMICDRIAAYSQGKISFESLAAETQIKYELNTGQHRDCIAAMMLLDNRPLAQWGEVDKLPLNDLTLYLGDSTKVFFYEQDGKPLFLVSSPIRIKNSIVAHDIALYDPSSILHDLDFSGIQHHITSTDNITASAFDKLMVDNGIYDKNNKTFMWKAIPGVNAMLELSADNEKLYEPVRENTTNNILIILFSLLATILLMRYLVYEQAVKLMGALTESKNKLNNEADRLRNLHEVVSRIALERDNSNIFTLITGMFYNMDFLSIAIYQAFQEGGANNFRLTGKSGNWAGLLKKNALLDRLNQVALSRNLESNILETDNSYSLMVPIIIRNELFGILYTRKKEVFSQQDIDIVLIMINYLVIFWELNNLIATTEQEALVDSLTAVWNRRYIMRRIKEEDEKLIRHGGEACIAILDLGNLKPINDQFGHSTGDKILKAIAQAIANSIRTIDAVGRSGGDEFIVLFPNTTMDEAQAALNRINTAVSEQQIEALDIDIIADFGLASCPQDAKSLMEALDIADERMYAYKRKRKENKNRRE